MSGLPFLIETFISNAQSTLSPYYSMDIAMYQSHMTTSLFIPGYELNERPKRTLIPKVKRRA